MLLTHYYDRVDLPFKSLSALSDRDALAIISNLQQRDGLVYRRFNHPENYLRSRRETEKWLKNEFINQGGKPKFSYPQYFVVDL